MGTTTTKQETSDGGQDMPARHDWLKKMDLMFANALILVCTLLELKGPESPSIDETVVKRYLDMEIEDQEQWSPTRIGRRELMDRLYLSPQSRKQAELYPTATQQGSPHQQTQSAWTDHASPCPPLSQRRASY
jgi:hypothetical protein